MLWIGLQLCLSVPPAVTAKKWTERCVESLERARRELGLTRYHIRVLRSARVRRWPAIEAIALYEKDPQAPKVYLVHRLDSQCAPDEDWVEVDDNDEWFEGRAVGCTSGNIRRRKDEPPSPRLRQAVDECLSAAAR